MPVYRATVWHLSGTAAAVDGDVATRRYIRTWAAESPEQFRALTRDIYINDHDAEVTIGPVSVMVDGKPEPL